MRATLMFETGWCGFGVEFEGGMVLCIGCLRITACAGRVSDRMAGYGASLSAAREAVAKTPWPDGRPDDDQEQRGVGA